MTRVAGNEMELHGQSPLTLVTAYFNVGAKPGHLAGNPYPGWIRNLLPFIRWPLVIFCDEQSVDMLKEARGGKPAVYHVTRPEAFYAYRYLDNLKRLPFPAERAEAFVACSLIWHEKHHFLRQAMSENPFGSEMFFWCDIGLFRSERFGLRLSESVEWPNLRVCRALPQDKVSLILIYTSARPAIMGNFFGGAAEPLRRWCDIYYQCLERCSEEGTFELSDEYVMYSAREERPEAAHLLFHGRVPWLRLVVFAAGLTGKEVSGHRWYFLSGKRFPWKYFCRRLAGLVR